MNQLIGTSVIGAFIVMVLLVIFWPFVVIWALNTLFGLGLAYTFWNWLAMLVLSITFGSRSAQSQRNSN
jgi:hypothetical protein